MGPESGKTLSLTEAEKKKVKDKIRKKVRRDPETGCWVWYKLDGTIARYPGGVRHAAHRESYAAYNGDIPAGMVVCHECDNPSCVNPEHLTCKTQRENMRDKAARGRARNGTPGLPALPNPYFDSTPTPPRKAVREKFHGVPRIPWSSTMLIEIVHEGRVLRQIDHQGHAFLEAPPEGDYTIRVTNTKRRARFPDSPTNRQLAVISVDGINIVDGEKAAFGGPGYVVLPGQTINIPGWRRTDSEVAKFQFKREEDSYSAQTGKGTSNTGVIGVAVFDEKHVIKRVKRTVTRTTTSWVGESESIHDRINQRAKGKGLDPGGQSLGARLNSMDLVREIHEFSDADDDDDGYYACGGAAAASCSEEDFISTTGTTYSANVGEPTSNRMRGLRGMRRKTKSAPRLGTGYGQKATMYTEETTFDRATEKPVQVITLQYAVREKLIEWGVPVPETFPVPSAFPASEPQGVPAPPGWQG